MEAKNHDRHEFNFAKRLREKPVSLIEEKPKVSIADLRKRFPVQPIAVCDVGVEDLYGGKLSDWGYEREGILNIDHHSPAPEMARFISSANLAIDYVSQRGVLGPEWAVVINHTDCDSILSSGIMRGIIPPEARFGEAAISADHTGAKNDIADMLQGLEEKRDIEYSLRNLELLLGGLPLDKDAKMALEKSRRDRAEAARLTHDGVFEYQAGVRLIEPPHPIESRFFPALLPDATAILIGFPKPGDPSKYQVKIRLGLQAPRGLMLNTLDLPQFGSRWNAGSTERHGGTSVPPAEYAKILAERMEETCLS